MNRAALDSFRTKGCECLEDGDLDKLEQLQVPIPNCECERLKTLRETNLMGSNVNEGDFGRYVNLAARLCKVGNFYTSLSNITLLGGTLYRLQLHW